MDPLASVNSDKMTAFHEVMSKAYSDIPDYDTFVTTLVNDEVKRRQVFDSMLKAYPGDQVDYVTWQDNLGLKKKVGFTDGSSLLENSVISGGETPSISVPNSGAPQYFSSTQENLNNAAPAAQIEQLQKEVWEENNPEAGPHQFVKPIVSKPETSEEPLIKHYFTTDPNITQVGLYPEPETLTKHQVKQLENLDESQLAQNIEQYKEKQQEIFAEQERMAGHWQWLYDQNLKQRDPEQYDQVVEERDKQTRLMEISNRFAELEKLVYSKPSEIPAMGADGVTFEDQALVDEWNSLIGEWNELAGYFREKYPQTEEVGGVELEYSTEARVNAWNEFLQPKRDRLDEINKQIDELSNNLNYDYLKSPDERYTDTEVQLINLQLEELTKERGDLSDYLDEMEKELWLIQNPIPGSEKWKLNTPLAVSYGNAVLQGLSSAVLGTVEGAIMLHGMTVPDEVIGILNESGTSPHEWVLYKLNQAQDWANETWQTNPMYSGELGHQVANGAGQIAAFIAGGWAGQAMRLPAWVTSTSMGALSVGSHEYQVAYDMTQDANRMDMDSWVKKYASEPEDVVKLVQQYKDLHERDPYDVGMDSFLVSAPWGALEGIVIGRFFGRLNKATGGQVAEKMANGFADKFKNVFNNAGNYMLGSGVKFGFEEGVQEMITEIGTNWANGELYDKTRDVFENVGMAGEVGGILGFTLGAMLPVVKKRYGGKLSQEELIDVKVAESYINEQLSRLEGIDDLEVFNPIEYSSEAKLIQEEIVRIEADLAKGGIDANTQGILETQLEELNTELAVQINEDMESQREIDKLRLRGGVIAEILTDMTNAYNAGKLSPESAEALSGNIEELTAELESINQQLESYAEGVGEETQEKGQEEVSGQQETTEPVRVRDVEQVEVADQITGLAQKIMAGETEFTAEELQLQQNNPQLLEQELNRLKDEGQLETRETGVPVQVEGQTGQIQAEEEVQPAQAVEGVVLKPYVTDDGRYTVTPTEQGVQIINNKTKNVIDPRSANYKTVLDFYKRSNIEALREGGRVKPEPGMTEDQYRSSVLETSTNPQEIAEEYLRALAEPPDATHIDDILVDHLSAITPDSFYQWGDKNYVTPQIRNNYFKTKKKGGVPLDVIAQEIVEEYAPPGMDEQAVIEAMIDFVVDNPGGTQSYKPVSEAARSLAGKFQDVAGFKIDEDFARDLAGVDEQASQLSDQVADIIASEGITKDNWAQLRDELFYLSDEEIALIDTHYGTQEQTQVQPEAVTEEGAGRVEGEPTLKPTPGRVEASPEIEAVVEDFVSKNPKKPYGNTLFSDFVKLNYPQIDADATQAYYDSVTEMQNKEEQARAEVRDNLQNRRDSVFSILQAKVDESANTAKQQAKDNVTEASIPVLDAVKAARKGVAYASSALNKFQDATFGKAVDAAEDFVAKKIKQANASHNKAAVGVSQALSIYFGGMPYTKADLKNKLQFNGQVNFSKVQAEKMMKEMWAMVEGSPQSLIKIHKLLDPEVYEVRGLEAGEMPTLDDLTTNERRLYETIKEINAYVHDYNFSMGLINQETYDKFNGRYIARLYESHLLGQDVESHLDDLFGGFTGSQKLNLKIFSKRQEMSEDLSRDIIQDPVFLTAVRLMQTEQNAAILKYLNKVSEDPNLVSDEAKPGFNKLEGAGKFKNIPIYGDLTNKYVAHHIAEDLRGYFFSNKFLQGGYEFLRYYDRIKPRQFYKKWNTIYAPPVILGNASSNVVFAALHGIDPVNYLSHVPEAIKQVKNATGKHFEAAVRQGTLGSNVITADFRPVTSAAEARIKVMDQAKSETWGRAISALKKVYGWTDKKATGFYQGTDDVAKVAAMITLMKDYGYSEEAAAMKVYEAFQNYATVGKLWDVASKTPLVGPVYVKFQADLQRILKNAALKRPLTTAGIVMMYHYMAYFASQSMDEEDIEREIRENRSFIPKIPFPEALGGNVPLTFMTPIGEVNLARYMSPFYIYDMGDTEHPIEYWSKFLPYQLQVVEKAQVGTASTYMSRGDVLMGPLIDVWLDTDFRGVSIEDPGATRYTPSGVTEEEKWYNDANYLLRGYLPFYRSGNDIYLTMKYGEDYYGRHRDITQVIINQFIKVQDVTDSDYLNWATRAVKNVEFKMDDVDAQIRGAGRLLNNTIKDAAIDYNEGKLTEKQFENIQVDSEAKYLEEINKWTEVKMGYQQEYDQAVLKLIRLYEVQSMKEE